ncbi:MAG: hypothetical protein FWF50_00265 [Defluviitaleaceae bacterium]|nr:hypothetical protein [Defluviitaleaceae bacterium]
MGGGRRRGGFGMGGMNNNFGGNQNTNRGSGCSIFIVLVILVIAIIMISSMFGGNGGSNFGGGNFQNVGGISGNQITASTIERTPLPTNSANIVGPWFTDNLGWIQNTTQMEAGLRNFHALTGVRPHVYITDNVNTANFPTTAQVTSFAVELYDELFNDEAHLLLVFFEPLGDNYEIGAAIGNQARSVIDQQALDILFDYIQRYYYIDGLSNEQFFSNAFNSAAERIMYVSHNPWPLVIMVIIGVIGAVLILIILKNWWKKSKAQKNLEAEQTEKILNTPLEGFGSTNSVANDLAKKYEDGDKE